MDTFSTGSMNFKFDEIKATQVAARFAEKSGGSIYYLMLMKLLYIVDREALKRWGRPVIGGPYSSMDYGPVISPSYDLVKQTNEKGEETFWSAHFIKEGYDLRLTRKLAPDELAPAEVELVDEVFSKFGGLNRWDLVNFMHKNFSEWTDPQGTSLPLPVEEILHHVGKSTEEIGSLAQEAESLRKINLIFGV